MSKLKVTLFNLRITKYREPFVNAARDLLQQRGIEFNVVYGQPAPNEIGRGDSIDLEWGHKVRNRYIWFGGKYQVWSPLPRDLADSDLFIVTQANRIWSNYPLLLKRQLGMSKVAYWGHGINFQSTKPGGIKDRWKRLLSTRVDWWFAYTSLTVQILEAAGYPKERITCLNNAIDTHQFRKDLHDVPAEQIAALRAEFSLPEHARVGILCGSLYPDKRLDYLLEACDRIHARHDEFRLFVIGDGPSGDWMRRQLASRPWIHAVGVKHGIDKAAYFRLAEFVLNPGLVGLHVLDAFAAGIPMVTTREARHSPEIAYLEDGRNGFVVAGGPDEYARAVSDILTDAGKLARARAEALAAGKIYTTENMALAFADGICQVLGRSGNIHRRGWVCQERSSQI